MRLVGCDGARMKRAACVMDGWIVLKERWRGVWVETGGEGVSEGWDSGDTGVMKSHPGGPVRFLSL